MAKLFEKLYHHKFIFFSVVSLLCVGAIVGTVLGIKTNSHIETTHDKWYLYSDWWNHCSSGVEGEEATIDDIGQVVPLIVNKKIHNIRLIDIDHDDLTSGGKAHCTFEFANLVSDQDGYSLATIWNTDIGIWSETHDYLNSDLRAAIEGKGKGVERLRWYQKKATTKSTIYTKPVLEMLPNKLRKVLKEVNKLVAIGPSLLAEVVSYDTKLFPLSYREITDGGNAHWRIREEGTTYQYYIKEKNANSYRMKLQVIGEDDEIIAPCKINEDDVDWKPDNYAGYSQYGGAYYWTRSPYCDGNWRTWYVTTKGFIDSAIISDPNTFAFALGVAPAFCI